MEALYNKVLFNFMNVKGKKKYFYRNETLFSFCKFTPLVNTVYCSFVPKHLLLFVESIITKLFAISFSKKCFVFYGEGFPSV